MQVRINCVNFIQGGFCNSPNVKKHWFWGKVCGPYDKGALSGDKCEHCIKHINPHNPPKSK